MSGREIKFRAWEKRTNQMYDNDYLVEAGRQLVIFAQRMRPNLPDMKNAKGGLMLFTDDENMDLMQFTGLKDKNGKEIYEGDILQLGKCTGVRRIIIWAKDSYATTNIIGERVSIPLPHDWHKMHIIGNIHENPELLKGE